MTGLGGERVVVVDMAGLGGLPSTRVACPPWLLLTEDGMLYCDRKWGYGKTTDGNSDNRLEKEVGWSE